MPSKTTDKPLRTRAEDEGTETLPVGHPKAGYTSPDLSEHDQTGTIPPEEKEWHEARNEEHDDEVERVKEGEAKVAKEEREEREKLLSDEQDAVEKQRQQKPPAPKQQAAS